MKPRVLLTALLALLALGATSPRADAAARAGKHAAALERTKLPGHARGGHAESIRQFDAAHLSLRRRTELEQKSKVVQAQAVMGAEGVIHVASDERTGKCKI